MTTLAINTTNQKTLPPRVYTPEDELLTFREAMTRLKVSRSTLYRLLWAGELQGHKVGSSWRFYYSDLMRALHRQTFAHCS